MNKVDISYEILMEPEQDPVRGNASAIDPETDRANEDWILERQARDDCWAWCTITVKAQAIVNGTLYTGTDHLGQCSYADEEDFKQSGYYEDMKYGALQNLAQQIPGARFAWPELLIGGPEQDRAARVRVVTVEHPDDSACVDFLSALVSVQLVIEGGQLRIDVKAMHGEAADTWDQHDFEVTLPERESETDS
jgi:hypothetical protein